jgi:hypothetical protein
MERKETKRTFVSQFGKNKKKLKEPDPTPIFPDDDDLLPRPFEIVNFEALLCEIVKCKFSS